MSLARSSGSGSRHNPVATSGSKQRFRFQRWLPFATPGVYSDSKSFADVPRRVAPGDDMPGALSAAPGLHDAERRDGDVAALAMAPQRPQECPPELLNAVNLAHIVGFSSIFWIEVRQVSLDRVLNALRKLIAQLFDILAGLDLFEEQAG